MSAQILQYDCCSSSMTTAPYCYTPLSSDHDRIRLLRLLPHPDKTADIHCELFEYTFTGRHNIHLYDALSYVWGDPNDKPFIFIHGCQFDVTSNLHAALSQLRNHSIERILWIDAICIDQENQSEKEHQIQFMAAIYGQANRTLVWLGVEADDSDLVFKHMRKSQADDFASTLDKSMIESAGKKLLHRTWFRRIWILQEVAAARNILIMCGRENIQGFAFFLGVNSMLTSDKSSLESRNLIRSVVYLIRGSIFRSDYSVSESGRSTLGIGPLSGLIDLYYTHDATKCHDKVYALLGMSTDDLSNGELSPNYELPWAELLQRLVKHVISDEIAVTTWGEHQAAVIECRGCIIGRVRWPEIIHTPQGDRLAVKLDAGSKQPQSASGDWSTWNLQVSATTAKVGDLICLLQGASKPSIIRSQNDYLTIVMAAVEIQEEGQGRTEITQWPTDELRATLPDRNFLIVWDWNRSSEGLQYPKNYESWISSSNWPHTQLELAYERDLARATRLWHLVLLLKDCAALTKSVSDYYMEKKGREAVRHFEMAIKHSSPETCAEQPCQTPSPCVEVQNLAMKKTVTELLLTDDNVDLSLHTETRYCAPRPFTWAVNEGCNSVVELLFDWNNEDADDLMMTAASKGYDVIVKLLLERRELTYDVQMRSGMTAFGVAADGGHAEVVRLLLETGKVDIDKPGLYSQQTPLLRAADHGFEVVVKMLLDTGKVDPDWKDELGYTPLYWAAVHGHESVVRLLLETGKVDFNLRDKSGYKAFSEAAHAGHEAVVRLLLQEGRPDIEDIEISLDRALRAYKAEKSMTPAHYDRLWDEWGVLPRPPEYMKGLEGTIALLREAIKTTVSPEENRSPAESQTTVNSEESQSQEEPHMTVDPDESQSQEESQMTVDPDESRSPKAFQSRALAKVRKILDKRRKLRDD